MAQDQPTRPRSAPVTLLDVAAAAGVSKSTVSRILDERLPRSESAAAQRVRQVAAELGYVRDPSAASLRRGKTMTIGVGVPRLDDTVMAMRYEELAHPGQRAGRSSRIRRTWSTDTPAAAAASSSVPGAERGRVG